MTRIPDNPNKNERKMGLEKVLVGKWDEYRNLRQTVEFEGCHIADGEASLYVTSDGRYLIHECQYSVWKGHNYILREIRKEELLSGGGKYELLGKAAGLWHSLSLDEVLTET